MKQGSTHIKQHFLRPVFFHSKKCKMTIFFKTLDLSDLKTYTCMFGKNILSEDGRLGSEKSFPLNDWETGTQQDP